MTFIKDGIEYQQSSDKLTVLGFPANYFSAKLTIPEQVNGLPVSNIAPMAFASSQLQEIYIPESINLIGSMAFRGCNELRQVCFYRPTKTAILEPITIAASAFGNCFNLTTVKGLDNEVNLNTNAFYGCWELRHMGLLISILEGHAFVGCGKLTELDFAPQAVLHDNCFYDCGVQQLNFQGDGILKPTVIEFIKDNNIKINCSSKSNVINLAYEGVNVEIDTLLELLGGNWLT